jgi:hypothetical protein
VLLGSSGLKVSAPGKEVVDALPGDLNFSSDFSGVRMLVAGALTVPANTTQVVYFPKTFATRPTCRIGVKVAGFDSWFFTAVRPEAAAGGSGWATCFENRIEYYNSTGSAIQAAYTVWDYNT